MEKPLLRVWKEISTGHMNEFQIHHFDLDVQYKWMRIFARFSLRSEVILTALNLCAQVSVSLLGTINSLSALHGLLHMMQCERPSLSLAWAPGLDSRPLSYRTSKRPICLWLQQQFHDVLGYIQTYKLIHIQKPDPDPWHDQKLLKSSSSHPWDTSDSAHNRLNRLNYDG